MQNTYEARAEKFIHQIYSYIADCYDLSELAGAVNRFNYDYGRKVKLENGLTRAALITSDYVVKFDFGYCYNINRFGGCYSECEVYKQAERDGYARLFAKPTMVYYEKMEFCIMPRVRGIGKYPYDVYEYLSCDDEDYVYDHVFDVHNKNYGWKDGYPIIFDYAARR